MRPGRRASSGARRGVSGSFIGPRCEFRFFVHERLFVQLRLAALAAPFPRSDVCEIRVVALSLAVRRLVLDAEVAAARFLAAARVDATEPRELEEVGHAAGLFEGLVRLFIRTEDAHVLPVLPLEIAYEIA